MNYPVYDLHLNSLIKGYFTMYFNSKLLHDKYISAKKKRNSLNKIFVSKAEVKHTSTTAIVTIYVYNREKIVLLKKVSKLRWWRRPNVHFFSIIVPYLYSTSFSHNGEAIVV